MKTSHLTAAIILLAIFCSPAGMSAHKKGYRLNYDKREAVTEQKEEAMTKGSFMVASQCTDCNNGYTLQQVTFSGYDKPQQSSVETFFITNNTDRTLTGVNLYIDYRMPDGRQLTRRFFRLSCKVPAGETRTAEIPTWDKQRSFVYEKSQASSKHPGTPYSITFDPIAYYLQF